MSLQDLCIIFLFSNPQKHQLWWKDSLPIQNERFLRVSFVPNPGGKCVFSLSTTRVAGIVVWTEILCSLKVNSSIWIVYICIYISILYGWEMVSWQYKLSLWFPVNMKYSVAPFWCPPYTIDLLHKSQNAPVPYPTMHHFVTEMCTCAHKTKVSVLKLPSCYELKKPSPLLAITSELRGLISELFGEKLPRYI